MVRSIIAVSLLAACAGDPETPKPNSTPVSSGDTGGEPTVSFSASVREDCVVCADVEVNLATDAAITVMVAPQGESLSPWVRADASATHRLPILELTPETAYDVAIRIDGDDPFLSDTQSFTTGTLPSTLPPIEVKVSNPSQMEPGLTLMTLMELRPNDGRNFLIALNADGDVVWYERLPAVGRALDVDELKRIYTTESVTGAVRIDPFSGTKTLWNTEDLGIDTVHHEVRSLDGGGFAAISTEHSIVPGWEIPGMPLTYTFNVISDVLTTFDDNGHLTWSWSLIDHFDPLEHNTDDLHLPFWVQAPYDHLDSPKDWSHGNAMTPNGTGWLTSYRNLDWLIQVDPDTDEVDYVFGWAGDFELAPGGRWFSHQHAPKVLPNGNILLYDNGNHRPDAEPDERAYTRVVEYNLNHETMTATEVWSWDGGVPRVFCPIVGDVDELPGGTFLITDGAIYESQFNSDGDLITHFSGRVREVANVRTEPEVLWHVSVGTPRDFDADNWTVYRSLRIDTLYPEHAQPR